MRQEAVGALFTHLHTHSCCSFLEGLPTADDLARTAAAHGMQALALTDHLSLTGALGFYRACRKNGIKPILGLEIDLLLPYRLAPVETAAGASTTGALVLLAENETGWRSLCRLSSALLCGEEIDPPLPGTIEQLEQHAEGLLCLTGGCRGSAQRALDHPTGEQSARELLGQLGEIFPSRLYVELHRQTPRDDAANAALARISRELGLPTAAAHNIYYLEAEQAALQRTAAAIRTITPLARLPDSLAAPPDSRFLSALEMERRFAELPEALRGTAEVAERCACELNLNKPHYPRVPLPDGLTAAELLRRKAEEGARRLYGDLTPALSHRLDQELETIAARGYEPIFLIAEEMIAYAQSTGVPSASRGSASSSLVAHCIGITTPDPLALDLYFERFLNPARATPPDIDTDFCSRRRDSVINHLFETYGQDQVAMVGTVNTYRSRSALGEVAKAHGFKPQEIRAMTAKLHHYWRPAQEEAQPGKPPENPFAALIEQHAGSPRHMRVFREASSLLGMPHHLSVHPGGVVIAPGPITDFTPVARSGGKGVIITQFDLDDVEACGLVKLDLLGIRGLTVLGDVAEQIRSWRRKEFRTPLAVLEGVPPDDTDTAAMVAGGRTIGCFQIESPGMRTTLKEIQARTIDDIMAALALYRPGPLKGGLRDAFVARHNHEEPVEHIHPALSQLLHETYGVILYQEQVLRIAHELAGLSLAEADLLRRAMSHFNPGRQMQTLKEKFITGAKARSNVPDETGARIWEMMAAFAGYGFPKAHAASYAVVAWRSAWCKAHHPAEFLAAVLANWGGYYPQSVYLIEARRMGISARPPHINHSHRQFSAAYPNGEPVLYMGLDQVRGLTRHTQERILRYRPFHSLAEFLSKVDPRKQEAENLIACGALEGLGAIPTMLRELSTGRPRPGQLSLFDMDLGPEEDWTVEEKNAAQHRLLGVRMAAHPLEAHAARLRAAGALTTLEAAARIGQTVRVAGLRQPLYRQLTGHGESMGFFTLEDMEGMLDVLLIPRVYQRYRGTLAPQSILYMIEGVMERDPHTGEPVLHAERVTRLDN